MIQPAGTHGARRVRVSDYHPAFLARESAAAARVADRFDGSIADHLSRGWSARVGWASLDNGSPVAIANDWLREVSHGLKVGKVRRAYDEDEIRAYADNYARQAARFTDLGRRRRFALRMGAEIPKGPAITEAGIGLRLEDARWWRRQLRKHWTRKSENAMRTLGVVRKGGAPYVSNEAVAHYAARQQRTREWMADRVMVSDSGAQLELLDVHDRSIANPALRRGEFMCRLRGFEEIAASLGHVAEFFTLTTPSAYHAQLAAGGGNPKYAGHVVREAQQWLCRQWAKARAKLKRLSILVYGFRVAEPHHDGTPHWHAVFFVPPHQAETLRQVIRAAWLSEAADDPGARERRATSITIDPQKGSAVGYVAKYVAKNIDGAGAIGQETSDETGAPVAESVQRVQAWASVHGIRQFQQIGGPPIGLWREARRVREPVEDADIERARLAADRGDWAAFIRALSYDGIRAGRRVNVTLEKCETGEFNYYGELRPARTIGLRCCSSLVLTRLERWSMERKRDGAGSGSESLPRSGSYSGLGPVAITVRAPRAPASVATWQKRPFHQREAPA